MNGNYRLSSVICFVSVSYCGPWALGIQRRTDTARGARLRWSCLVPLVAIAIIGWIDLTNYLYYPSDGVVFRTRNFFGTLVVLEADKGDPDHYRLFKHGATVHGLQFVEPSEVASPRLITRPRRRGAHD